mmetsp:Transcript_6496/g.8571  ORF Transcript_6496/g.8571 Transcript_6496/m.8571 type:complete len:212 (-) Transcript_6496:278-913(-)
MHQLGGNPISTSCLVKSVRSRERLAASVCLAIAEDPPPLAAAAALAAAARACSSAMIWSISPLCSKQKFTACSTMFPHRRSAAWHHSLANPISIICSTAAEVSITRVPCCAPAASDIAAVREMLLRAAPRESASFPPPLPPAPLREVPFVFAPEDRLRAVEGSVSGGGSGPLGFPKIFSARRCSAQDWVHRPHASTHASSTVSREERPPFD